MKKWMLPPNTFQACVPRYVLFLVTGGRLWKDDWTEVCWGLLRFALKFIFPTSAKLENTSSLFEGHESFHADEKEIVFEKRRSNKRWSFFFWNNLKTDRTFKFANIRVFCCRHFTRKLPRHVWPVELFSFPGVQTSSCTAPDQPWLPSTLKKFRDTWSSNH